MPDSTMPAGGPVFGVLNAAMGEQHFAEWVDLRGNYDAQGLCSTLTLAVASTTLDARAIECLRIDADDIERGARDLAAFLRSLADFYDAKREAEPDG